MSKVYRNKSFMFILSSHFIHKMAECLYDLAMPLLVLYVTGSSVLMGAMYALGFVAEFLVGFFGGSIVDAVNRKKLLIIITTMQAIFISILPLSSTLGVLNIILVFLVAFILDFCIALYRIADTSIIPQLVDKEDLPQANGYMQVAISTAEAIGPAISGLLITLIGLFHSLWINFGAFLLLMATLLLIRYQVTEKGSMDMSPKTIWFSSIEGLRYTWKNRLFRSILIWNLFVNFGLSGAVLMILYHLKEVIQINNTEIGFVMTMSALGGIISGIVFPKLQGLFKSGNLLFISSFVTALSLFIFPYQNYWYLAGFFVSTLMFSVGLNSRLIHMLFQANVPNHMLGRVISASRLISTILAPISVLLAGWISESFQSTYVFIGGAVIIASSTLIALRSELRSANWSIQDRKV